MQFLVAIEIEESPDFTRAAIAAAMAKALTRLELDDGTLLFDESAITITEA